MDLTLSLTHDCNLACSYCYAGTKHPTTMSWEVARQAVDFALSFPCESAQLGYFGGEPLLAWDLLMRSADYADTVAAEKGIRLKRTVTTNGTLLNPARAAWLKAHDFYPALSLDGNRAMHEATRPFARGASSFDACLRGLEILQKEFPAVEVIVVPDPANIHHLDAGVRFLAGEQGVTRVSVNPNFYAAWPPEALAAWRAAFLSLGDYYVQRYRENRPLALNFIDGKIITRLKDGFECRDRCNFGEREIAVAPSGRIYPCERIVADDTNADLCIGDVFAGFAEARRQEVLGRRGNVNAECLSCGIRRRCMNWCCCINYALTGAIDRTDGIICFHERLAVEVADHAGETLFTEGNAPFLSRFYYEDFQAREA